MDALEAAVLKNLETFVGFARKRTGDAHLAQDLVQESLVKALAAERRPSRTEDTTAWFYRILRRTIIDLYRARDVHARAIQRLEGHLPEIPETADERMLCRCFKRLLPALPLGYRELLEAVDLEGEDQATAARRLGLSRNNLTVRLHRARRHLRDLLAKTCRACSRHGCLDCTCGEPGRAC